MAQYDATKTKNLLSIVGAFTNMPGGEFCAAIADQLREAETEITAGNNARLVAEGNANKYASELATLQSTLRILREENEALKAAVPVKKPKAAKVAEVIELPENKKAL